MALGYGTDQIYSQAYRHRLDGVAISTYVLIMLLVPLKIFCRQRHGGWHNVRMDDYMSMFALACANGFFYVCIIGTSFYILPMYSHRTPNSFPYRHAAVAGTTHYRHH